MSWEQADPMIYLETLQDAVLYSLGVLEPFLTKNPDDETFADEIYKKLKDAYVSGQQI